MIKHEPQFDTDKICEHYTEKDGVPVKYVCTSTSIKEGTQATDIFYRATPHPEFGNRYFGLYRNLMGNMMITNADKIEDFEFGLVEDDDGDLQYSAHRHDYKQFKNGNMIDGGRAYIRCAANEVKHYVVRNGEMVEVKVDDGPERVFGLFEGFLSRIERHEKANQTIDKCRSGTTS